MKIFNSISDYSGSSRTVVTLGTFDGVHSGHRKILNRLTNLAAAEESESLVLTFFPHPRMVLNADPDFNLLNTIQERQQLLKETRLKNLVIQNFNEAFSSLTPEQFVKDVLVDTFKVKTIIIGYDHRFGKGRAADINDLIRFGNQYNFNVEQIPAEQIDDISVSSTKIREALIQGEIKLANQYLGYNYFLTGTITEGKKLGRTIGYPTANLTVPEPYKLIPKKGVYVVRSMLDGKMTSGMMNIGTNPTVAGKTLSIETHFFDFDGDLYNKNISIEILERLRDEVKFDSLDHLKHQLSIDRKRALEVLGFHS